MTRASPFIVCAPLEGRTGPFRTELGPRNLPRRSGRSNKDSAARVASASITGAPRSPPSAAVGAAGAVAERLVHDAPDGARATSALRTAAEAAIDFARRARRNVRCGDRGPHLRVAQYVTGTNDHGECSCGRGHE